MKEFIKRRELTVLCEHSRTGKIRSVSYYVLKPSSYSSINQNFYNTVVKKWYLPNCVYFEALTSPPFLTTQIKDSTWFITCLSLGGEKCKHWMRQYICAMADLRFRCWWSEQSGQYKSILTNASSFLPVELTDCCRVQSLSDAPVQQKS